MSSEAAREIRVRVVPRTYWARRSRPPSQRALADAALTEILAGIYEPDENGRRPPECLYGSVSGWPGRAAFVDAGTLALMPGVRWVSPRSVDTSP